MKKILILFAISFVFLFLFSVPTHVAQAALCIDPVASNGIPNFSAQDFIDNTNNNSRGLVPCGISNGPVSKYRCRWSQNSGGGNVHQDIEISGGQNDATATAQCQGMSGANYTFLDATFIATYDAILCPCALGHFFIMGLRIFKYLLFLSAVIAGLMITIGGLLILLSGVNPNGVNTGKTMILWSVIGVATMICAWLIISILMTRVLGVEFSWNILPF